MIETEDYYSRIIAVYIIWFCHNNIFIYLTTHSAYIFVNGYSDIGNNFMSQ